MRISTLLFVLLFALCGTAGAQVLAPKSAVVTAKDFTSVGNGQYTGTLEKFEDYAQTEYGYATVGVGDSLLDGKAQLYQLLEVISRSDQAETARVRVQALSQPQLAPNGRGGVFRGIADGYIPQLPHNSGQVTPYLSARISLHNVGIASTKSGFKLDRIAVLGDTSTIIEPRDGQAVITADSTLAFYKPPYGWIPIGGGSSGGSGGVGDDWGNQVVITAGGYFSGSGTGGSPLTFNPGAINAADINNNGFFLTAEVDGSVTNELQDAPDVFYSENGTPSDVAEALDRRPTDDEVTAAIAASAAADLDKDPTNEIQDASGVALDGADYRVAPATTVQEFADKTESALEKALTTTVLTGGVMTTTGATTVNITGGSGQILDNTDPANSKYYAVTWPTQNLSLSSTAQPLTYWYVDSLGTIRQTLTPPVGQDLRTRLYLSASYYTASVGAITGTVSIVTPAQHTPLALAELSSALGALKVSGLAPAAAGTGLQWRVTAGTIFDHGANWPNSEADPHRVVLPQFSTADGGTFRAATATTINPTNRTTLDVANYQSGGVVTPIPGNVVQDRYGIHYVFVFPGETANYRTVYGDSFYTSVDEALADLDAAKAVSIAPVGFAEFGVLVGAIIAEKDETDNANFTFASTNVFRLFGGGLVSAGASDAVQTVVPGTAILVNSANPANPVVSADTTVLATRARSDAGDAVLNERVDSLANAGASDIPFDGSRVVRRGFQAGQITNATTVVEQLEFLYYAPPTLSLSSSPNNTLVQVGTVNTYTLTSTTSNPGGATLSNGRFERGGVSVESFGSATSATHTFTFAPGAPSGNNALSYTYRSKQDYTPEDGTAQSSARTYSSAYPILYGQSATDYRSVANGGTGQNPYPAMEDPLIVNESDQTVTFNGTGVYLYYLVPTSWNDTAISQILDPNGFPVSIDEWNITTVQVTTTDTENTIVLDYIMLSTIETKNPDNAAYTFIF